MDKIEFNHSESDSDFSLYDKEEGYSPAWMEYGADDLSPGPQESHKDYTQKVEDKRKIALDDYYDLVRKVKENYEVDKNSERLKKELDVARKVLDYEFQAATYYNDTFQKRNSQYLHNEEPNAIGIRAQQLKNVRWTPLEDWETRKTLFERVDEEFKENMDYYEDEVRREAILMKAEQDAIMEENRQRHALQQHEIHLRHARNARITEQAKAYRKRCEESYAKQAEEWRLSLLEKGLVETPQWIEYTRNNYFAQLDAEIKAKLDRLRIY